MRLFFFKWFQNRRQSEPVVVEQPPALVVIDEKLSEERLRHMFHLGVIAGYKQRKEEEEQKHRAEISSLKTVKQKPAQPVLPLPVQAPSQAQQTPLQFPNRAGGLLYARRAKQRVEAKLVVAQLKQQEGKSIIPARPRFHNAPTIAEFPTIRRNYPDAG